VDKKQTNENTNILLDEMERETGKSSPSFNLSFKLKISKWFTQPTSFELNISNCSLSKTNLRQMLTLAVFYNALRNNFSNTILLFVYLIKRWLEYSEPKLLFQK
jgi:hypothetical protein